MKKTLINGVLHTFQQEDQPALSLTGKDIRTQIADTFGKHNLCIRLGLDRDIEQVQQLQADLFHPNIATLETGYELFRVIRNGYLILIEDKAGKLLGFYSTIYYHLAQKEGYGVRVGVAPQLAGFNFAALLAQYAISLAMDNGCASFRALMSPTNVRSASNVLNHIGYYCEKFYKNIPSMGERFEIVVPLHSRNSINRQIDIHKVIDFIHKHNANQDFILVKPTDTRHIQQIYSTTDFKIIAFLRAGAIDESAYFFAIKIAQQ